MLPKPRIALAPQQVEVFRSLSQDDVSPWSPL
jgi:hypothetical protein